MHLLANSPYRFLPRDGPKEALGACYRVCVDDHDLVVVACLAQLDTRDAYSQGVLVPVESVMPAV